MYLGPVLEYKYRYMGLSQPVLENKYSRRDDIKRSMSDKKLNSNS
jgi:hypothetical protein